MLIKDKNLLAVNVWSIQLDRSKFMLVKLDINDRNSRQTTVCDKKSLQKCQSPL